MDINLWNFQGDWSFGVPMTSIKTFSEVRSLGMTWWPDLEWPGPEIFRTGAKKMYEKVCRNRGQRAALQSVSKGIESESHIIHSLDPRLSHFWLAAKRRPFSTIALQLLTAFSSRNSRSSMFFSFSCKTCLKSKSKHHGISISIIIGVTVISSSPGLKMC